MHRTLPTLITLAALLVAPILPVAAEAVPTLYSEDAVHTATADTVHTVGSAQLVVKAGSVWSSLEVQEGALEVTVPEDEAFEVRVSEPPVGLENGGLMPACDVIRTGENRLFLTGPLELSIAPSSISCSTAGSSNDDTPTAAFSTPASGAAVAAGAETLVFWTFEGKPVASVRLRLSEDGGKTFPTTVADWGTNQGFFAWTPPTSLYTRDTYRLKIEGMDAGRIVAFAVSDVFSLTGGQQPPPEGTLVVEPYDYEPEEELRTAATIGDDKELVSAPAGANLVCIPETRIKPKGMDTVYYCGKDGKRYVFPNRKTHDTWYGSFVGVVEMDIEDIQQVPLAGNVTYRPGSRLVKVQSSPEVFAVAANGTLRYVVSEAVAERLYGKDWNTMVDDIPDAFFTNYTIGAPIYE